MAGPLLLSSLTALPLVAILRGIQPHEAVAHARALLDAGFDCIEVPTNSPEWPASIAAIVALAGTRTLVGAGTVLTTSDLDRLQAAGGRLAVSPHVDPALIAESVRRGLVSVPGAMTPSEIFAAWRAGARSVKLFPAATLGVGHVRALVAVLPADVSLLAVGGVASRTSATGVARVAPVRAWEAISIAPARRPRSPANAQQPSSPPGTRPRRSSPAPDPR